ncbi:MAG: hypothetical protein FWE25_10335 [Lachnospiraceae bacterium]|nr:hypothetical protein [Lachnospiraceae bacterium]
MNKQLIEVISNPIKNRVFLEILSQGETTAKHLIEKYQDIPQATLYRYLKKMVADGLIKIVEERQVRNVTEKTYAVAIDFNTDIQKMIDENDGEAYLAWIQQLSLGIINEFKVYTEKEKINIKGDGSGFRLRPFYATRLELEELSKQIQALVAPLQKKSDSKDSRARTLAVVITPPLDV